MGDKCISLEKTLHDLGRLFRRMKERTFSSPEEALEMAEREVTECIKDMPAEEPAPVRKGKWMPVKEWEDLLCSACGARYDASGWVKKFVRSYKYCPNCGARMAENGGNK